MEEGLKDYYRILGVEADADAKKIKAAYRRMARENHPDTKPAREKAAAEERIKEINEAHGVLGDPKKRAEYDQMRAAMREAMRQPKRRRTRSDASPQGFDGYSAASPFAGGFSSDGSGGWERGEIDPETLRDLFGSLFGGARPKGPSGAGAFDAFGYPAEDRYPTASPGPDLESEIELPLLEAFRGTKRKIRLSGGSDTAFPPDAAKRRSRDRTLEVAIPPGVRDGVVIRLKGQGGAGVDGAPNGDLLLTVRLMPDERFTLQGDDVETTLTLRPDQAALGCQLPVQTLDGTVRLTVPPHSRSGHRLRLAGKGWPSRNGSRGDLHVRLRIDLPDSLTLRELALYRQLAEIRENTRPQKE